MKYILLFSIFFFICCDNTYASEASAKSYILMDEVTGRVILGKNYNTPYLVASITKILTCLIAIESGKLDETVTVDETINEAYGSGIYIEVGEELTLKDLLYGLMLRSGNDAALMTAKFIGGSVDNFVIMMNKKAKEIGMLNSNFVNPSGLDNTDSGNYSTAYDMALLTRYANQYKEYLEIVGTKKYKVKTNKKTYIWYNKNKLLEEDYITGGKTGYTKKAKRTLVSSGEKNNIKMIVVTLNDSDDWNTHRGLYEYAFSNYIAYKVLNKKTFNILGDNYYNATFYIKNDVYIPFKKEETKTLVSKIILDKKNTYKEDDLVGKYIISLDNTKIYEENIYIKELTKNKKISFFKRLKELFND